LETLHYLQRGHGEAVLLMHGLFGSAANLGALARHLQGAYRTISLDLRNHGKSPWHRSMSYPEMAADVIDLLDRLQLARASLVGHSMGGKVAMQVALQHPQRVSAVVVGDISPASYPPRHAAVLQGLEAVARTRPATRAEAEKLLAESVLDAGTRSFLLKSLRREGDNRFDWAFNLEAIARGYANLMRAVEGTPFDGPALFIKGALSDYLQKDHRAKVLELFPAAELKVIPGAGHWLHADKPALFNGIVSRFLERHQAVTA